MLVICPRCQRKFEVPGGLEGQFFRCICSALLRVPVEMQKPPEPKPVVVEGDKPVTPEGLVFPVLDRLIDLSRFHVEEVAAPVIEDALPPVDDLPSFDEPESASDDIEAGLPEMEKEEAEDLTDAQKSSLSKVKLDEPKPLDIKIRKALEELAKSDDQQFIVDMLYFLLEIKDLSIRPVVEKFAGHKNPITDYLARRILLDLKRMEGDEFNKGERLFPYNREKLFQGLFNGNEGSRSRLIDQAVEGREFAATPYFILQLLREGNAETKVKFLTKLGLIASRLEAPMFARFFHEPAQKLRLAVIEGLNCIGGAEVIPYLVGGLVDKDLQVAMAIKNALKGSDPVDLSQQILKYLITHDIPDKKGYIGVLSDLKTNIAYRALVWMFDDQAVRTMALDAVKIFSLQDDLKAEILSEYLTLSYDDSPFCVSVIEVLETLDPTFSRLKLIPITVFDETYVKLVRESPLFARDFSAEKDQVQTTQDVVEIEIQHFGLSQWLKQHLNIWQEGAKNIPSLLSLPSFLPRILSESVLYLTAGVLIFGLLLKGRGDDLPSLQFSFMPGGLSSAFGASVFGDMSVLKLLAAHLASGALAFVLAFAGGSGLALFQTRRANFQLNVLATIPLLVAPVLAGFAFFQLQNSIAPALAPVFYFIGFVFPLTSLCYVIHLKTMSLIHKEPVRMLESLGFSEDQAMAVVYGPAFRISTILCVLLGLSYILSATAFGYFEAPDKTIGANLLNLTRYPSGWILLGFFSLITGLLILSLVTISEALLPLICLGPIPSDSTGFARSRLSKTIITFGFLGHKSKKAKAKQALKEGAKAEK